VPGSTQTGDPYAGALAQMRIAPAAAATAGGRGPRSLGRTPIRSTIRSIASAFDRLAHLGEAATRTARHDVRGPDAIRCGGAITPASAGASQRLR
jgi:hypothetical protein